MKMRSFLSLLLLLSAGCELSGQVSLVVPIDQPPILEVLEPDDLTVTPGESVILGSPNMVSGGIGSYHYLWQPAEFLDNTFALHPEAIVYETTTFTLLVTDGNGCSVSAHQVVYVEPNGRETRSGKGDGFTIYPIPARDLIRIAFPPGISPVEARYTVVDAAGTIVLEVTRKPVYPGEDILRVDHLRGGLYTLIITAGEKTVSRQIVLY